MTRRGRVYTPKESILAEELIAETIGEDAPTFTGPVSVEMIFNKESTSVTVRSLEEGATGLRGDLDNYIKLLLDGIQRSPLIENDRQVLHIDAVKT
jgi:Holliday junction resolvase RusA-like endonuclease